MTDTPEIEAAREALMEARTAWQRACDAKWIASLKVDLAAARLLDLLTAAKKEPTDG